MLSSASAAPVPTVGISPSTSPVSPAAITLRCERICLFMLNLLFRCELLDVGDRSRWQGPCRGRRRVGTPVSGLFWGVVGSRASDSYCSTLVSDTEARWSVLSNLGSFAVDV